MSKQNLAVSGVGWAGRQTTDCLAGLGSSGGQRESQAGEQVFVGLGLMWRGLAWCAGGLFIDTSTYLSWIGFIMEKFYGDMLY